MLGIRKSVKFWIFYVLTSDIIDGCSGCGMKIENNGLNTFHHLNRFPSASTNCTWRFAVSGAEVLYLKLNYLKTYFWNKDSEKQCGDFYSQLIIDGKSVDCMQHIDSSSSGGICYTFSSTKNCRNQSSSSFRCSTNNVISPRSAMEVQYYVRARSSSGAEPVKGSGFRLKYAYIKCDQDPHPSYVELALPPTTVSTLPTTTKTARETISRSHVRGKAIRLTRETKETIPHADDQEAGTSMPNIILIGAGAFLLILATCIAVFVIRRRRANRKNDVQQSTPLHKHGLENVHDEAIESRELKVNVLYGCVAYQESHKSAAASVVYTTINEIASESADIQIDNNSGREKLTT